MNGLEAIFGSQPESDFNFPNQSYPNQSYLGPREQTRGTAPRSSAPAYYEKEPPTEFQRYVTSSIGQALPIFGASLFERVPATFAPTDLVPVTADYIIAPGDELQVTVWGQLNFSRRLIVGRTGEVLLPDAGPVSVAGMKYSQAAAAFKSTMAHLYKNFDLSVSLGRLHSIQIFVVGEARRPGSYTVSSLTTLVNAVFVSGGPSARGSMRNIELKRGEETVRKFDLYELLVHGDKSNDGRLAPGDVILIPPAGPRVAVTGSVEHPAIYELKTKTTLGESVRLADGLSALATTREAVVERVVDGSALRAFRIPLTPDGLQTELHNGDIVRLLPVVPRFENTVTIHGNVADAGRFPWHPNMRVSDVIPTKEALLTREYWKEQNALINARELAPEEESSTAIDTPAKAYGTESSASTQSSSLPGQPMLPVSGSRLRTAPASYSEQAANVRGDSSLGAAMAADNVPPVRSFLPRNIVQPSAPDINWEYAAVERLDQATLSTKILPFNLGKLLLTHDAAEDLPLEPGDVITIFSKADFAVPRSQQAKQVRLEGEIARAGMYTVFPGETLRQVVARAGGLTPHAYLYGAQFTRESTRREQQKRYDDFLSQFDREVSEAASNLSSRITSPQQAATAQTSLASQRELVERLRKVAMNGRIVLNLDPISRGEGALPDLPLENGDRLYVPSRPSTVNVIGTVFEQASFLYEEDLRVGDYLKKSGGPARSADRSHMFVVRADGSVVSRTTNAVLFSKSFDTLRMNPGDTLIVPTYINRTTFVRSFMDWSQIFSNLALGAAAINVLY
ncbi:MAG: SLBB domain-containing protein [Bryobacteraceae bacterium]